LSESDVILFILDGANITSEDKELYEIVKDKNTIVAINKSDKGDFDFDGADIKISALKKDNLENLKNLIFERTVGKNIDLGGDFLCEERHFNALTRAKEKFAMARNAIGTVTLDMLAIDVKDGWDALGEISGRTATEEIINDIFSKFCVGK
jgi:tRNA modification GTPase